ncbi:hypothetical protein [Halorhabdus salina]|uniref:hypothetical protein n=1 Tax=Halorhabdus salina TaxID=2750670 RepID=UPI0015EF27AF|nr:hypothetical protein [Halorhabdus salina]
MVAKCKLCRHRLDQSTRTHCTCGWALDETCADNHEPWCPTGDGERWIGAQEI